ncbi:GNAT family N-acetyltransferase, partial [Kingella kingae]|uniref:GNAT family N-acetyltransferase n=1 Tax=Kingella kingae TaxID=504 RepID=UPI001E3791AF
STIRVLLGRLAVDERFTGQGLGRVLLVDAIERVRRSDIVSVRAEGVSQKRISQIVLRKNGFSSID